MKEYVEKQIRRMDEVFKGLKVKKESEILDLAERYLSDAKYFLSTGKVELALEAVSISWAYVDALLHLGYVEVGDEFKDYFTV